MYFAATRPPSCGTLANFRRLRHVRRPGGMRKHGIDAAARTPRPLKNKTGQAKRSAKRCTACLPAGQPVRGVHNGATAPRRHHGAAREGAPRLGDMLGVLLPYGHERPQRRSRSRGLGPRYTTRPRTSHDVVGLVLVRTMGTSHRRAGAAATSITAPPRLDHDGQAAVVFVCDVAPVKRPLVRSSPQTP